MMRDKNWKISITYIKLKFEAKSFLNKNIILKDDIHYMKRESWIKHIDCNLTEKNDNK